MTSDNNYWGNNLGGARVPGEPGDAQMPGAQASSTQPSGTQQAVPQAGYQSASAYQAAPGTSAYPGAGAYQAPYQHGQAPYPTQASYQAAPQKKSRKWVVVLVVIACLLALVAFSVSSCMQALESLADNPSGLAGVDNLSGDAIGVIDISGTIQYDGTACSPEGLKELLDAAKDNEHIKAVVLRVNSGGGTATAGEEMAEYLRQFDKPVVVSSASINASAAYEISSQADYIYVAKSTEIGAIGTVMEMTDLSGLFEKLGISMEVIASAESKDSTYGYRALTDEEKQYYQRMVDQINDMFVENVALGRKMDEADVRKLATGLVFTGVDAVENGLADAIGTREDALDKAAELAGISDYDVTDLRFSNYDISSLAYLFGETRMQAQDIAELLKASPDAKLN